MKYDITCDHCGTTEEIRLPWQDYDEGKFPPCPACQRRMRRVWTNAARLDFQSKGRFGFVTRNMGDEPVLVHDYKDMQAKLKSRGLHVAEPSREDLYIQRHMGDRK